MTNDAVKHPFRRSLPYMRGPARKTQPDRTDLAFFAISFVGFFVIIMGMTL